MKDKILVGVDALASLLSLFNVFHSSTQLEKMAWCCSCMFAFIAMMNQIQLNRCQKSEDEE